jgi:hypothetical protein
MRILPAHDPEVFAEFADEDCPRCNWIRRIELAAVLLVTLWWWLT